MANRDRSATWGVYMDAHTVSKVVTLVTSTGWSKSKLLGTLIKWILHGSEEVEALLPALRTALATNDINPVVNVARHVIDRNDKLRTENIALDAAVHEYKALSQRLRRENDALKAELAEINASLNAMREQVAEMDVHYIRSASGRAALQEENDALKAEMAELRSEQELLNKDLSAREAQIRQLQMDKTGLSDAPWLTQERAKNTEAGLSPEFLAKTLLLMTQGNTDNVALITGLLAHTEEMRALVERMAAMEKELADLRAEKDSV